MRPDHEAENVADHKQVTLLALQQTNACQTSPIAISKSFFHGFKAFSQKSWSLQKIRLACNRSSMIKLWKLYFATIARNLEFSSKLLLYKQKVQMPRSTGNCCQNVAGLCRVALSNSLIALQLMATSRDKKAEAKAKAQAKPR